MDWQAFREWSLVYGDRAVETVKCRTRALAYATRNGFQWDTYQAGPRDAGAEVARWLAWKKTLGKPAAYRLCQQALNDVARWMVATVDPGYEQVRVPLVRLQDYSQPPYTGDELRRLLTLWRPTTFSRTRSLALLHFALRTGLRRRETHAVRRPDIERRLADLAVRKPAKRGLPRTNPLPVTLLETGNPFGDWLDLHESYEATALWITQDGHPLSLNTMTHPFTCASMRLGFPVNFVRCRRTHATVIGMLQGGEELVAQLYGYNDPRSAKRYMTRTTELARSQMNAIGMGGYTPRGPVIPPEYVDLYEIRQTSV